MATLISARLPEETADRIKQYSKRKQRSLNETVSTALEEWLRQNEFAFIEFRETQDGRIAYMKNSRLPVYQVIETARLYEMDLDRLCAYWPDRQRAWLQAALNYYESYRDEVDTQIALSKELTFDVLKRRFPQLEVVSIPESVLSAD